MKCFIPSFILTLVVCFLFGCATSAPNAEFTKTINFSSLDTFHFKHTLVTGMDFRESEEYLLETLSEATINSDIQKKGFTVVDTAEADFFAVVKWKKAVSNYVNPFDHVDGAFDTYQRRNNPSSQFASRLHLTLEIYETSTRNLFWRKDMPNVFDALQLTEERIMLSLQKAVENFPEHIEKDPNLPSIE